MPAWLLWLAPVPLATAGAICWTAWSARTRAPAQAADTVAAQERFRQALAVPPVRPPVRPPDRPDAPGR